METRSSALIVKPIRAWALRLCLPLVLTALPGTGHAQAALADGGFDSQGASVSDYCYSCPTGAWVNDATGAGFVRQGDQAWPAPVPKSSPIVALLQFQGEWAQTFTATGTGSMRVSLWVTGRSGLPGNQTVLIRINGTQVGSVSTTTGDSWKKYVSDAFAVTAGSSYTLTLTGTSTTDQTAFVDNVALVSNQSTVNYSYDALGRLVTTTHTGGQTSGVATTYAFDKASNRTQVQTSGSDQ